MAYWFSHTEEQATHCCLVHCYHMGSLKSDDKLLMVKKIHGKQKKKTQLDFHTGYRSQEIMGVRGATTEKI